MNSVVKWCIDNAPPPKNEGRFYSYAYVQLNACGYVGDIPGRDVRNDLDGEQTELFLNHGIGVQIGAKSGNYRGIRLINLR